PPALRNGLTSQRPPEGTRAGSKRRAGQGIPWARRRLATVIGERTVAIASAPFPHKSRLPASLRRREGRFSNPPVYIQGPAGALSKTRVKPSGYERTGKRTVENRTFRSLSAKRSTHHGLSPARHAENAAARALAPQIRRCPSISIPQCGWLP